MPVKMLVSASASEPRPTFTPQENIQMAKSTEELIGEIMDGGEVEPVETETIETAAEETVDPVESAAEDDAAPAEETAEQTQARERDEAGRFAAKPKGKPAAASAKPGLLKPAAKPAASAEPPAPAEPVEAVPPPAPATRPPQSWTPGEREIWGRLPAEAQAAVLRREQETARALNENAQLRRVYGEAQQYQQRVDGFVRPFEGIFRARGVEPMQGVANVVQTYAALHYAPPQQKAQILAGLISEFSNVDDINAVLSGQAPAQPQAPQRWAPPQPAVDPRAIVREEFQALRQQALEVKAKRDLDAFLATKPEFLDDVADDTEKLIRAGLADSYPAAYEMALALPKNKGIQTILSQRKQREAAPQRAAAAQRARAAASSVRSTPGMAAAPKKPSNVYEAVEQVYAELEGQ